MNSTKRTPPPPGKPGRRWKGRRGYSNEELIRIASNNEAYILVPDFNISQRKRRHVLFDSAGEPLLHALDIAECIDRLRDDGRRFLIMVLDDLPKPAFCLISDTASLFHRSKKHG